MKKLILVAIFFLNINLVFSQGDFRAAGEIKNEIPEGNLLSNPDVSAFQKVNMFDMNLYTGKANINIPIYEIKTGDLSIPITLNYDTGGIKVDDIATSVGQNWSLSAGGSISRIIKDFPDNEISFGLFAESDWDLGTILNPELNYIGYNRHFGSPTVDYLAWGPNNRYAVYSEAIGSLTGAPFNTGVLINRDDYQRDFCPDLFIASAPSLNTKFTCINNSTKEIYPNSLDTFTTTFLDNSGNKMTSYLVDVRNSYGFGFGSNGFDHHGRINKMIKDFFSFQITNEKGFIYNFNEEEVSESFLVKPNMIVGYSSSGDAISAQNENVRMLMNNYSKKIHTWNLSSIKDTKGNEVIFQYETYSNGNVLKNKSGGKSVTVNSLPNLLNTCIINSGEFYQYLKNHLLDIVLKKDIKKKRLSKIVFNEGEVNFTYSLNRDDYTGEKALTEITIKNIFGEVVKKTTFSYVYYNSKENCNTPECKRLFLSSINEVSPSGELLTHEFEYNQANLLPKKQSLEQDYFGYYNNNGLANANNSQNEFSPKLFFYENNGKNSLLPFQRTDVTNHVLISGEIDLIPNNNSLKGLLNKINYPTGAELHLEYENNTFQFLNQNYTGGGARIKNQKIYDNGLLKKQLNYEYKEEDNKSSGYMNNFPVYGNLQVYKYNPFQCAKFAVYDKPKVNIELTNGNYIGYSRVIEYEIGKGKTIYLFSSPKEIQNVSEIKTPLPVNHLSVPNTMPSDNISCMTALVNNSAFPSIANIDYDYKRGKLLEKKVFDETNNLLQTEKNDYINRDFVETNLSKTFVLNYNDPSSGLNYGLKVASKIKSSQYLLLKSTSKDYFGSQNITNVLDFSYTNSYPFVSKLKSTTSTGVTETYNYYPLDSEVSGLPYMTNLISENRIGELIKQKSFIDNNLKNTILKNYDLFQNSVTNYISNGFGYVPFTINYNQYLSKCISTSKGINPLQEESIITKRDFRGNIIEYRNKGDFYIVILYGYKHSLPIAKIENATYAQVQAYEADLQDISNTGTEASLISALNNLRTVIPNAMITTYTHRPLIGISTATDPKGNKQTYHYDSFNRLQYVKDAQGNIVSENEYHYKN